MISRNTLLALVFAGFATLSLAAAAEWQHARHAAAAAAAATAAMPVYTLPRVVVVGKVTPAAASAADGN